MSSPVVSGLWLYPLKSARGIKQHSVTTCHRGFAGDRDWMIVDDRGRFVSQRTCPAMAMLSAIPVSSGLQLDYPGKGGVHVPFPLQPPDAEVQVWEDHVRAVDAGQTAADWLSRTFDRPMRLVWLPLHAERRVDPKYAGPTPRSVAFADGYPVLLVNVASLEDLNGRLPRPITMERFRPNIAVSGWPAFEEDRIRRLRCAALELELVKPCTRCSIPSLDPLTGASDLDPTPVLKTFRYDRILRGVTFGVNALVTAGKDSVIEVGQPVEVLD